MKLASGSLTKYPKHLKKALGYVRYGLEIAILFSPFGAVYLGNSYDQFRDNDVGSIDDGLRYTRQNPDVEPYFITLFPDSVQTLRYGKDGDSYFAPSAQVPIPQNKKKVRYGSPDSTTTLNELSCTTYMQGKHDAYKVVGQPSEGYCVVYSTMQMVYFTNGLSLLEKNVIEGIHFNGDSDGSPDIHQIVSFIRQQTRSSNVITEYMISPQSRDIGHILKNGGKVMINVLSKGEGQPHWIVAFAIANEDGRDYIYFHDSGRALFDESMHYLKSGAEGEIHFLCRSGAKRKCPVEVFQKFMDYGLIGNPGGSAVRWATDVSTVAIVTYPNGCLDADFANRVFSFSRNNYKDSLLHIFTKGFIVYKEYSDYLFRVMVLLGLIILYQYIRLARKWGRKTMDMYNILINSSPEEKDQ